MTNPSIVVSNDQPQKPYRVLCIDGVAWEGFIPLCIAGFSQEIDKFTPGEELDLGKAFDWLWNKYWVDTSCGLAAGFLRENRKMFVGYGPKYSQIRFLL